MTEYLVAEGREGELLNEMLEIVERHECGITGVQDLILSMPDVSAEFIIYDILSRVLDKETAVAVTEMIINNKDYDIIVGALGNVDEKILDIIRDMIRLNKLSRELEGTSVLSIVFEDVMDQLAMHGIFVEYIDYFSSDGKRGIFLNSLIDEVYVEIEMMYNVVYYYDTRRMFITDVELCYENKCYSLDEIYKLKNHVLEKVEGGENQ